ncbi:porin family protein [Mangrovibacterium marinum]|uniref:porin family protein n=1 Tax=Mangrovibacterium marinum TaxID=1639118 RepID=UPI002A1894D1|nr:porin family protein [Mangrovibacterium marinum]
MKRIIVFFSLLLISATGFSQTPFQLSFTASPSVNWMSPAGQDVKNNKSKMGYEFGVHGDFYFDPEMRYAFTTGLLVSQTGGELTYDVAGESFNFAGVSINSGRSIRYRLKYIEIPYALKMRTRNFYRWRYWGLFGLSSSINISAKGDSSDKQLDKTDISREVKLFNTALNLGLGGEYDLGERNSLIVGVIYKDGFMDITKNSLGGKTTVNSLTFKLSLVF